MTPVTAAAAALEKCGLEPSAAANIAAKMLLAVRQSYGIVPLQMEGFMSDVLRRKGFTDGGAESVYKTILLGAK